MQGVSSYRVRFLSCFGLCILLMVYPAAWFVSPDRFLTAGSKRFDIFFASMNDIVCYLILSILVS